MHQFISRVLMVRIIETNPAKIGANSSNVCPFLHVCVCVCDASSRKLYPVESLRCSSSSARLLCPLTVSREFTHRLTAQLTIRTYTQFDFRFHSISTLCIIIMPHRERIPECFARRFFLPQSCRARSDGRMLELILLEQSIILAFANYIHFPSFHFRISFLDASNDFAIDKR